MNALERPHPPAAIRLARVARTCATLEPGVAFLVDTNRFWRTVHGSESIDGVLVVAGPDGRYTIELHVVVEPTRISELARSLREHIGAAADGIGLGASVGSIDICIDGLIDPEDSAC